MALAIGIDLGTTNTRVAVFRNDQFEIIPHEGRSSFPSIVAFTDRVRLIGEAARIHGNIQPQNAIYGALNYLGLSDGDWLLEEALIKAVPFKVIAQKSDFQGESVPRFVVSTKEGKIHEHSPIEILAMILKRAKKDAEGYLGYTVTDAVITVPALFNYVQRFAIRDAAIIAGINPLLLIHSPTAALWDLTVMHRVTAAEHNVLICDVGARYINVTCAILEEGIMEVKSVAGDFEAGDAYNKRLVRHMIRIFEEQWPDDIDAKSLDSRAMHRLRKACEHVKHQLSSRRETILEIESFYKGRDFRVAITRTRFEELIQDLVRAIVQPIEQVLRDGKIDKKSIDDVVLIGGSSRIPKVQQVVREFFDGKEPLGGLSPEETAVRGAAVQAAKLSGDTSSKSTVELLVLDVTAINLGIGTAGGVMTPIVRRASTIPTKKSEVFEMAEGDGSDFTVTIFEGNRARIKDCLQLGQAHLPITRAPGDPKTVEVSFDINRDNVLSVELRDKSTGKSEKTLIDGRGNSRESFKRLTIADCYYLKAIEDQMQTEDDAEQKRIEARNTLEELLYSILGWSNSIDQERRVEDVSRLVAIVHAILRWLESDVISNALEFESRAEQLNVLYKEAVRKQADWEQWKEKEVRHSAERTRTNLKDRNKSQKPATHVERIQEAMDHLDPFMRSFGPGRDQYQTSDDPGASHAYPSPDQNPNLLPLVDHDLDQRARQGNIIESTTKPTGSNSTTSNPVQHSSSTIVQSPNEHREERRSPSARDETRAFLSPTQERLTTMTPDSIDRSATPRTAQRGLASLFTVSPDSNHIYTDTEFVQISTYLKNTGQPDWSLVPRLYTVLRLIDGLDLLNVFIEQGMNDIWFPFGQTTLPRVLSPSVKANFLKYQDLVLSKSLLFEKNPERKHVAFQKGEPLPYEVVGKLGHGAHGQVDKVLSTVSHREYARKLFQRMRGMRKDAIKSFLTELQVLKRIQHYHCVELVQSYTDPKFFALIMSPVGDCNLQEYYSIALHDPDKSSLLRSFLGCLANALQYLHGAKIRHRDIKPHNILVKGDRVFLTDFGIALDWEELSRSTTTADSGKTWVYAAPEVVRYEKRNTSADIWSLGCVFMEIATTLKGQSIAAMREFFEQESGNYRFYANVDWLAPWMDQCRRSGPSKDDVVFHWALLMLEEDADKRPNAASLHHDISAECAKQGVAFCGTCCLEVGESSGIEDGSDDDAWDQDADEPTVTGERVGDSVAQKPVREFV